MARLDWLPLGRMGSSLSALARQLPARDLLPLGVAIFALFGLLGPVVDILSVGRQSPATVLMDSVLAGIVALGYAYGVMRRQWWVFGAAVAVQVVWIVALSRFNPVGPADLPNPAHLALDGGLVIVFMTVSYAAFLGFINGTASRYLTVRAEIALARQIHQVLVPAIEQRIDQFEFLGFSHPSGEVGGDLVDVAETQNGWLGYAADVSGHGVSSGVVMGMFKSALRMRLRQQGTLAELLTDLNTVLYPLKTGSMFITLACCRFCGNDTLEYAVAGHLPILRVRGGAVDEITTAQVPIAMFDTYPFRSAVLEVRNGDLLVLMTDGLVEVFDAKDQDFGLERAKSLLAASAERPLREIADALVSAARAHGKQLDDQTLLLIRRVTVGG